MKPYLNVMSIRIKQLIRSRVKECLFILFTTLIFLYLVIAIYFSNHFLFHTTINGVDVSLKRYQAVDDIIANSIKDYKLQLLERNKGVEDILGEDIGLEYTGNLRRSTIFQGLDSIKWVASLMDHRNYRIEDLFSYDSDKLEQVIKGLNCMNKAVIAPQNVSFQYVDSSYVLVDEVYGNQINEDKLLGEVKSCILSGDGVLDLDQNGCYHNPNYTKESDKTAVTRRRLNQYVSTRITYLFGSNTELVDGNRIKDWLQVDDDLEVFIDESAVTNYVKSLSKKYDTVGKDRMFRTSTGKQVLVKGGLYGWKMNYIEESKALLEHIKQGKVLRKEPLYIQKALYREEDEIGSTYVEINITKQHLWFYKDGRILVQGDIVTGNPGKGNATKLGTHMINYKQKSAILEGANYRVEVTYWMPFYGNMGIHDAKWRNSFGGTIYQSRGTHGCVNAPYYLAKTIYENIEEGTPVIVYEE